MFEAHPFAASHRPYATWIVLFMLMFSGGRTEVRCVHGGEADSRWQLLQVPDVWKRPPAIAGRDGFQWFRCAVTVPISWQGTNLELALEAVDDARAVFFNGQRIGGFGDFPPQYRSGLGETERFVIKANIVQPGKANVVAIRLYRNQGRENFNVAAPVLFGGDEAIRLQGKWQFRSGDDLTWAAGDLRDFATFGKLESAADVAKTLKKLSGEEGPLSPAESLKRFQVADDLAIELVLSDPVIGQPLSMKWDERGRLWLMQYLQYPNPAGLKMVSRDQFLRTVYDKVPPAPPHHFRGADKITIHEDADRDGVYDQHKTFVDGLSLASSFAIGRSGVFVLNPPYLLFYKDQDQDDLPDGDPEVLLEGFGIEDSHSLANSLTWGPDGWLYACQGSTVTGNVKHFGTDQRPVHSMGQLIWRYHPETRRYEIFAEGGGNAFGIEIDSHGRLYSGHNGGDTRGFHYVQGGYFRKGFGKHGELSNPYAFGYLQHMPHHSVPRFTHTFVIYESGPLPAQYQGKLFGVEPLQGRVVLADLQPHGSSFRTQDLGHPVTTSDTWFRPVDIQVGPDEAVYIADFYEQRIDHSSHYQGRVHKTSGRIYRLRDKQRRGEVRPLADKDDLLAALKAQGEFANKEALRIIGDRKDRRLIPTLKQNLLDGELDQMSLRLLWALNLSGGFDEDIAGKLLAHSNAQVRLGTVRLLCDNNRVSPHIAGKLAKLAASEENVEVRSQLACSARRLPADDCLPIVRQLLTHSQDTHDVYLPLLLWWAIESKCGEDREAVVALFRDDAIWELDLVRDHITERLMRRFAQAGKQVDLVTCAELLENAPSQHAQRMLAGFERAFSGRSLGVLPDRLLAAIGNAGGGSLALRLRQSDAKAIDETLQAIVNNNTPLQQKLLYIEIFGQIADPRCIPALLKLAESADDDPVRAAALSALQSFVDAAIGDRVVALYNGFSPGVRDVAQTLLASRPQWSLELLKAIDAGKIKTDAISATTVRKILLHENDNIALLVEKHWGSVSGATSEKMLRDIQRYATVIGIGSGNPYRGEQLFAQNCGKCHVLFGKGGYIGPDLTAYQREDLHRMLVNVVNPSIEIREGYEQYAVLTLDGRVLTGFIADQDNRVVVLRGTDGSSTVIARDEIDDMRALSQSVMPAAILQPLMDQQIRDLFAYLRSSQPLP